MARRNKPTKFPVSSGLLEALHVKAIAAAIWVFLVLVDSQTGDDGEVMYGQVIQSSIIAERLGFTDRTVREHLAMLEAGGYIRRELSNHGWRIWIANPKHQPERAKKHRKQVGSFPPLRSEEIRRAGRKESAAEVGRKTSTSEPVTENFLPELRVLRAGINTLTPDSGKKEDPEKTPPTPSTAIDHEAEFDRLKRAYPKDTLINAYLTESAWVDAVLSAANPRAILDQVWAGLERMKASGTPVRWLPTLKDFLLLRRYTEAWPREDAPAADQPADVDAVMERARARRRAEQEAASR